MSQENEPVRLFFFGPEGAGRRTASEYIRQKYNFWTFYISDIIADLSRSYFGMTRRDYEFMVRVSLNMKDIHQQVWIIRLDSLLKSNWCTKCNFIITDRGAKFCSQCGGLLETTGYHNVPEKERVSNSSTFSDAQ